MELVEHAERVIFHRVLLEYGITTKYKPDLQEVTTNSF